MNDAPLRLFDILPMVEHPSNWALISLLAMTLLFTLVLALWYRYFTPLAKLRRALIDRSMTPRQVCHQLAGMTVDRPVLQQLDTLRFQRSEPTFDEVDRLIKRVGYVL